MHSYKMQNLGILISEIISPSIYIINQLNDEISYSSKRSTVAIATVAIATVAIATVNNIYIAIAIYMLALLQSFPFKDNNENF